MQAQALSVKDSVNELLPIVRKSATAQSIVVYLAERDRHRTDTDLKRLKYDMYHSGVYLDERDYSAFWEELSKAGTVGRLIRATTIEEPAMKNGKPLEQDGKPVMHKISKPAKFHWNFSYKSFGQEMVRCLKEAGIDPTIHSDTLAKLEAKAKAPAAPATDKPKVSKATMSLRISAGKAKLFIPYGLTKEDAEAISKSLLAMAK